MMMISPLSMPLFSVLAAGLFAAQSGSEAGSSSTIVNSVVGASVILVVGMFLRFLTTERAENRKDRATQEELFRSSLERIVDQDRISNMQTIQRLDALAQHQGKANDELGRIAARLERTT